MVWTGLNESLAPGTRVRSRRRGSRASARPSGCSFTRSTFPVAAAQQDLPLTIRPGRSTIRRIERAVTLLPQPVSPTMPSVCPGGTSKLAPSTARVVPSSATNMCAGPEPRQQGAVVVRWRTVVGRGELLNCIGSAASRRPSPRKLNAKIDHDRDDRHHEPRRERDGLDVLRLPEHDAPAISPAGAGRGRGSRARLADDHRRERERRRRDDVAERTTAPYGRR